MITITFHYRYRKQLIIAGLSLLIISSTIIYFLYNKPSQSLKKDPVIKKAKVSKEKNDFDKDLVIEEYKVDIKGEVNNPGIYTMSSSSRVIDCIEKAGGLTANANTTVINLSKKISDEMVIIIYSNAEVEKFKETKKQEEQVQDYCRQKDENSLKNDACISNDNKSGTTLVSINSGSVEELSKLPGIGEAKAKKIIEYRDQNGLFKTIEDIKNVPGVGENIFAQIKDYITTG